jgi:hypothetical protein
VLPPVKPKRIMMRKRIRIRPKRSRSRNIFLGAFYLQEFPPKMKYLDWKYSQLYKSGLLFLSMDKAYGIWNRKSGT